MNNYLRHILLPVFVGFLIFTVTCLISSDDVPQLPQIIAWDKIAHFGMFFVLSAVSLFDYYRLHNGRPRMSRWVFWGFILPVIYGAAIELMQKYFFSSRSAELADFLADLLGSLTAWLIALFLYKKNRKQEKKLSL
ncbi:MAG: VanZ family protein [Petrimonas sp.]|jgi:VanZ family protein|uniref:VanZ-like domain-containing protein n=1 Tax=bioreactor metagenome TaxID=1076179 RepID=A0A645A5R5_9ZZZZ|nr:VanZ family protein [Petrimonas sp.]HAC72776.1 VanZ family protein [Porphyromonadaceae bacterium]MDD3541231.1 VanZ family protein [Petrimonas sp.]MDD4014820.1 VanZ family protein [Petrimonas sp.]MDD4536530.1 VanZ family protein [Petrimonas sp.]